MGRDWIVLQRNYPTIVDMAFRAADLTAKAVKDHLDRTFLEALRTADPTKNARDESEASPEATQQELDSLYTEVDDVMAMVIAQQHGNPLRRALENVRRSQQ
jgi:hypothetical protein